MLVLQTIDPRESQLPDVCLALVRDAETGEVMEVDTSDPVVRVIVPVKDAELSWITGDVRVRKLPARAFPARVAL